VIRALDEARRAGPPLLTLAAVLSLADLGEDAAGLVPDVLRVQQTDSLKNVFAAITALSKLNCSGPPALDALMRSTRDKCAGVRVAAAAALVGLGRGHHRWVRFLARESLKNGSLSAINALGDLGEAGRDAVPALVQVLLDPNHWRGSAAWALGRMGVANEPVLEALRRTLDDDSLYCALKAAKALLALGKYDVAVSAVCMRALKSDMWWDRRDGAELAGKAYRRESQLLGEHDAAACSLRADPQVIERLVHASVFDRVGYVRDAAVRVLKAIGTSQGPTFEGKGTLDWIMLLEKSAGDSERIGELAWRLEAGGEHAVPVLVDIVRREARLPRIRSVAVRALARIRTIPDHALRDLVRLRGPLGGRGIVSVLVRSGEAAVNPLVGSLRADATSARYRLEALGRLGPRARSAVPLVLQFLKDSGQPIEVRAAAARALGRIGHGSGEVLFALAQAKDAGASPLVLAASLSLAKLGYKRTTLLRGVLRVLRCASPDERLHAVQTLRALGSEVPGIVAALMIATKDPDPAVRIESAAALFQLGQGNDNLARLLARESLGQGNACAQAIGALGDSGEAGRAGIPGLLDVLRNRPDIHRAAAAVALGEIGVASELVVEALRRALADQSVRVALAAANALCGLGVQDAKIPAVCLRALDDKSWKMRVGGSRLAGQVGRRDWRIVERSGSVFGWGGAGVKLIKRLAYLSALDRVGYVRDASVGALEAIRSR